MEVKVIVIGNVQKLHVFYSVLALLRRNGRERHIRVSIFLELFIYHGVSILFVMVLVFMCCGIDVSKGKGKAKGHCSCQVTNSNHTKC